MTCKVFYSTPSDCRSTHDILAAESDLVATVHGFPFGRVRSSEIEVFYDADPTRKNRSRLRTARVMFRFRSASESCRHDDDARNDLSFKV